jgi:hypothetical protein
MFRGDEDTGKTPVIGDVRGEEDIGKTPVLGGDISRRRKRYQEDPGDRTEDVSRKRRRHQEDPGDRTRWFKEKMKTPGRPW